MMVSRINEMRVTRQVIRGITLWVAICLLVSCAVPSKKKVGLEAPPEAAVTEAGQQLAWAEKAYEEGKLEEAAQRYEKLATRFPQSPEAAKALLRQGEIDFRSKRFTDAVLKFERVINRYPVGPEGDAARLGLLRCYVQLGRFNDAVETGRSLANYLTDNSQRAEAAEVVGDSRGAQEQYPDAVSWYIKAYELAGDEKKPVLAKKLDDALAHLDREQLLAMLGEYPEGFPNLRLQTRLAEVEMESGLLAMALERLQTLIDKETQHDFAQTWRDMADRVQEWLTVDMTTIGCLIPLTGRYQAYGDKILRGLVMAAQDINAQAGDARAIKLVIKDSAGHPDMAAAAVRELVLNQKVAAIVGPLSRLAAEAAAKEAQNLWVPIITLTQKTGVSEIGDYVFRDFLSNEQQARALVEYAVLGLGYSRFAILYPNDGYGTRLAHLFWDELDRLGLEVRGMEAYEPSQMDFSDQIKKLVGLYYPRPETERVDKTREAIASEILAAELGVPAPEAEEEEEPLPILDFEAIFIPDSYEKVGLIAPQLVYHDVTGVKLLGTNLWNSSKLIEMAGPYLQGAVFVDGFFPESRLPLTRQFVRHYEESYGEKPGYTEAQAYDTIRLLSEALHQPAIASRPQLRDALLGIKTWSGVAGTASVSEEGEVNKQPFLITIKRRRMAELDLDFEDMRQRKSFWDFFTGDKGSLSTGKSSPIPKSTSRTGIH